MIKAYRNLDKWKATASYSSWLKKIAINTGYDYFRKNQRQPVALAGREESDDILSNLTCQSEATQRGRVEEVQRLLSDLSAEDRLLLTLQYLEGLQLNEIAEKLNWGLSKAKVKSFRAKRNYSQNYRNMESPKSDRQEAFRNCFRKRGKSLHRRSMSPLKSGSPHGTPVEEGTNGN